MKRFPVLAAAIILCTACSTETPGSLRQDSGPGPNVRFDLTAGFGAIPWPNDTLCWLDDAESGACLPNLPTATLQPLVADWVRAIDATRGWSTTGPIVIPLARAGDTVSGPAIDLTRFLSLQGDNDWTNDAIYLVDLDTGLPHTLDFPTTRGSFMLHQPMALDPSDPRRHEPSLTAETIHESYDNQSQAGTAFASGGIPSNDPLYRQDWDSDSDGTLDVATMLTGHRCAAPASLTESGGAGSSTSLRDRCIADELVDAYEFATHTLRIYPRTPLAQNKQYAVVLTDRLIDNDERPIRSPFSGISHPRQHAAAQRVVGWLKTPELARYYGSIGDDENAHVRVLWSFTTSSPSAELRTLARRYQGDLFSAPVTTRSRVTKLTFENQYDLEAACDGGSPRHAVVSLLREAFGLTPTEEEAVAGSYGPIAKIVSGTLSHPRYVPDVLAGTGNTSPKTPSTEIPFWLTVPKSARADAPLRVVFVSHEQGSNRLEGLRWAGQWANLGLATLGFDRIDTQPRVTTDSAAALERIFAQSCVGGLLTDLTRSRIPAAEGVTNDIDPELIATRERWRADAVELASFALSQAVGATPDISVDPSLQLSATAFVGIGTGAATAALAASLLPSPVSLVMVDPTTSPERAWSRGATWRAPDAALWRVFGPRLAGVPIGNLGPQLTRCNTNDASIRLVDANSPMAGAEIGCLPLVDANGTRFANSATVIATNLTSMSRRCVGMNQRGQFSLGMPAAANDRIELAVYSSLDVVTRFGRDADCTLISDDLTPAFVLGIGHPDQPDSFVTTSTHGLGLERQSSELLRALDLAASAFSLANPAPFVADLAQPSRPSESKGLLLSISPGNRVVPPSEGLALARAARLIPRFPPANLQTYWELAADTTPSVATALTKPTAAARVEWAHLDEGVPRLQRFPPNSLACGVNVTNLPELRTRCPSTLPTAEQCAEYLPDLDALAGALPGFGAVQPIPVVRLARYAGLPRIDNLTELWSPQSRVISKSVQPTHPDWPFVALALPLANPRGSHGIPRDDVCERFRFGMYVPYLFGQFIVTGGTDYPPVSNRDTQQCLAEPATCSFTSLIE